MASEEANAAANGQTKQDDTPLASVPVAVKVPLTSAEVEKPSTATNGGPAGDAEAKPDASAEEKKEGQAIQEKTDSGLKGQPKDEKEAGDKRDHTTMAANEPAANTTEEIKNAGKKETKTDSKRPAQKKQKVEKSNEPATATGNDNEAAKRGPGRPKKSGAPAAPQKKKAPTPRSSDGIGSRTRSRQSQA